jgi:hypothetical protein
MAKPTVASGLVSGGALYQSAVHEIIVNQLARECVPRGCPVDVDAVIQRCLWVPCGGFHELWKQIKAWNLEVLADFGKFPLREP